MIELNKIINADVIEGLKQLPDEFVNCVVTSPPYWGLRDYGVEGQIGLEKMPEEYVAKVVEIFCEVRRVLRPDGTLWLNLGDSYAASSNTGGIKSIQGTPKRIGAMTDKCHAIPPGLKPKDLVGIPWRVAFALQSDGWYLRQDIIWQKPNPMPESVTDRCTKSHEYIFLLTKSVKYYFDAEAIQEDANQIENEYRNRLRNNKNYNLKDPYENNFPAFCSNPEKRNKRSVWTVTTQCFKEAHFATFPENLITDCIKAGCPKGGIVLDPFMGSGTTGLVAIKHDRNFIGIELNPTYIKMAEKRIEPYLLQGKLNFDD